MPSGALLPVAVLSNTGSLFRIYKLLTFTVYEKVKCKLFFFPLSLRGSKGSNKLRRPWGKPQMTSVYKASVHRVLITLSRVLPSLIAKTLHSLAPLPPWSQQLYVQPIAPQLKSGAGCGFGNQLHLSTTKAQVGSQPQEWKR